MLKDFVDHLNISFDPDILEKIYKLENTLVAWEIVNYLCMMVVSEEAMAKAELTRKILYPLERQFKRMRSNSLLTARQEEETEFYEMKTGIYTEKSRLLVRHNRLISKNAVTVGKGIRARELVRNLIVQLDRPLQIHANPREIIDILQSNFLGLHPSLKAQLELSADQWEIENAVVEVPMTETEKRQALWSEKFGIDLPNEEEELQSVLSSYFNVIDEIVQMNPDIQSYLSSESEKNDEYYLKAFELLYLIDAEILHAFFLKHDQDIQVKSLQLISWQAGQFNIPFEAHQTLSQYLYELSNDEFVAFLALQESLAESASVFVPQDINEIIADGKLPNFKSKSYKLLILRLLNSATSWVSEIADKNQVELPSDSGAIIPQNSFQALLGEDLYETWLNNQNLVMKVLRPTIDIKKWSSIRWTVEEAKLITIYLNYQVKNWGPGGSNDGEKIHFLQNLLTPNKLFQRKQQPA